MKRITASTGEVFMVQRIDFYKTWGIIYSNYDLANRDLDIWRAEDVHRTRKRTGIFK